MDMRRRNKSDVPEFDFSAWGFYHIGDNQWFDDRANWDRDTRIWSTDEIAEIILHKPLGTRW